MTTLDIELLGAMRELAAVPLASDTSPGGGRPPRRFALELHVADERTRELEAELQMAATTDGPHLRLARSSVATTPSRRSGSG
ncbi:hypothetical protein ADL25_33515 [Streptomyces sp. NRRL F-5122]|uniref:hypothetical protein n=1 Tax=Streptomyces sp. NRRL F-5122 TaxID=1609098 RepID=UPI00074103EC|nr:hypothetical protein [Streptomyces sp. NRRL F-5122]KUJ36265.1 hypothetical protein ADL25_33515 [Streptomyces sp. NRRL F-5122]